MDHNELLLAYYVRQLAMRFLDVRAPEGLTEEDRLAFDRANYASAVKDAMKELRGTAKLMADSEDK